MSSTLNFFGRNKNVAEFASDLLNFSDITWLWTTIIPLGRYEAYCVLTVTGTWSVDTAKEWARDYSLRLMSTLPETTSDG